jgi:predicted MFS family arabinose efflux permease
LLLVGAPAKAVLTGVVGFALPILLSGTGWRTEDVGQVIMLYACGVLAASSPVARLVDRGGRSGLVVGLGGIGAGLALLLMSAGAVAPVVAGVLLLGLAHGLVNAPVITYVTESGAAERLGAGGAAALYRVVERVGHVLGPLLVGQLLAMAGAGMGTLAWIGAAVLTASVLFMLPLARSSGRRTA